MPEKTQAEMPYAVVEYTATFRKPIIEAWGAPTVLVAAVLEALQPAGFKLEGIEQKTQTEKLSECMIVFRRTNPIAPLWSLGLGLGKVVFTAENLEWTEAGQVIEAISTALNAIIQTGRAQVETQLVSIGMHIQLKNRPRQDVTAHLLDPVVFTMLDGEVKFSGIIMQRERSTIVIDGSLAYANGLFIRINREHGPDVSLPQAAEVLRNDQVKLFEVLGLEGIL